MLEYGIGRDGKNCVQLVRAAIFGRLARLSKNIIEFPGKEW